MAIFDTTRNVIGKGRKFIGGTQFSDPTDFLATRQGQYIQFVHVPTQVEVFFKAYITNFSDNFASQWQATEGYGRMDAVQTFQGTKRTITIGFDVVASSIEEAKANMSRISTFANMLYPVFDSAPEGGGQTIKSAPLIRMKFMNWAQNVGGHNGLLGTLNGFSFNPVMERGVLHDKHNIYPTVFSVQTTLTVIHEEPLGWSVNVESSKPKGSKGNGPGKGGKAEKQTVTTYASQTSNWPYGSMISEPVVSSKNAAPKNPDSAAAMQGKISGGGFGINIGGRSKTEGTNGA